MPIMRFSVPRYFLMVNYTSDNLSLLQILWSWFQVLNDSLGKLAILHGSEAFLNLRAISCDTHACVGMRGWSCMIAEPASDLLVMTWQVYMHHCSTWASANRNGGSWQNRGINNTIDWDIYLTILSCHPIPFPWLSLVWVSRATVYELW